MGVVQLDGTEGETNIVRVVHRELHTSPALLQTGGNTLYYFRTEWRKLEAGGCP